MTAEDKNDPMNSILDAYKPYMTKMTFGSIVGYCSGAAAKEIGKAIAVVVGLTFIVIQSASYSGLLAGTEVKWDEVQKNVIAKVDANGDGKFTMSDIKIYWGKVKHILTRNVPSAGGFGVGFMYGLTH